MTFEDFFHSALERAEELQRNRLEIWFGRKGCGLSPDTVVATMEGLWEIYKCGGEISNPRLWLD
jgi:hypothetical protein